MRGPVLRTVDLVVWKAFGRLACGLVSKWCLSSGVVGASSPLGVTKPASMSASTSRVSVCGAGRGSVAGLCRTGCGLGSGDCWRGDVVWYWGCDWYCGWTGSG
jgi:hypothetical protein